MKNFEKYSYLLLSLYLLFGTVVLWLLGYLLGWNPQTTVMLSAKLTALPFLAWVALTVYYLARWIVRKAQSANKAPQERLKKQM